MKVRYPALILLSLIILQTILDELYPLYGPPTIITSLCEIATIVSLILTIYALIKSKIARRSSGEAEELERQREAERREIDMVRKSNDILLHLIQDEHREEGDR